MTQSAYAAEPVCAEVKIEIKQELTFERQGFDANMKINNELDSIPLEDVTIRVNFKDSEGNAVVASSDPNATDAKFYIRIDSLEGIDSIEGGIIPAQSTADIHWLIVPSPGASSENVNGTLYYVGADLSYTVGGELEEVTVAPDFIRVTPLPEITLDYFLTRYTNGDDPLTEDIEAIEPFTLGVRVQNNGTGIAKNLKIESAQPKIVENEQGLLIDFRIVGSTVNDQPSTPSLLVNFGDIPSGESSMGRWLMETSLAGEFTEFTASYSHADELGGELTSVIDAVNTHFLVHDVLVDLPGRDSVRDFLADNNGELKVFESNNVDTLVANHSANASLAFSIVSGADLSYNLTTTATDGFSYVSLEDTFTGSKVIKSVVRSDGKVIKPENAWYSKERAGSGVFNYRFNLFDVQSTGSYTVVLSDKTDIPLPPNIQFIPDRITHEGKSISFLVEASDPNGTLPALSMSNAPTGAVLSDQGNGRAVFTWTPAIGQAGRHEITYVASDGVLANTRKAFITVNPANDTDGDGMDDAWEMEHFGTLDRDGTGDFDGDGISDLDEFLQDQVPTNPNVFNFTLGNASVGGDSVDVALNGFVNPIIIAGVPSDNDSESAITRLRSIKSDGFKIRLQEWNYQDGTHELESVPFIALEKGRHQMQDGSIWEVGTFDVVSEKRWVEQSFIQPFEGVPQVYLTIQTTNDSDPVVVRAKDITETGFSAALFEEESNSSHGREVVGYLAIYSSNTSGNLTISGTDYLVNSSVVAINNEDKLLSDGVTSLRLEEEISLDEEVEHAFEDVAVLMIDDKVFAQDISTLELDTVALRRHSDVATVATPVISPAGGIISEAVSITIETVTEGASVYYTLDGSTPDSTNNPATLLYSAPFTVDSTSTVKAIATLDGFADSLELVSSYTLVANTPPEFIEIPDRTVSEGQSLTFVVQALDQNTSQQAALSVDLSGLSGSPIFIDNGNGTGRLSWIPPVGSESSEGYTLTFVATDSQDETITSSESMKIIVTSGAVLDSDSDGMPDEWELQYSLDPYDSADAQGDADGDGINNLDEYLQGRNPLIVDVISENNPPVAEITASSVAGNAPLTVQFSGTSSTDSDGTIISYVWTTDDGGSGSEVEFNHTFEQIGNYTVNLTVTDNSGAENTKSIDITVTESSTNTVYEDAEDGTTDRWRIFDNDPAGASITNVVDTDTGSNVIQLQGTGTQNGFILGNFENREGAWNDTQNTQIKWSLKSEAHFTVYVRLMTTKGWRYLYYQPVADDRGMHANGKYIHHALGVAAKDGTWQTFTRDLVADLKHYEPDNELLAVNAFLVRGNVSVDDIELSTTLTISDTTAPSLILNGDSLITLQQGELYVEEGASASDYTDGVVGVSITGNVNTATSGFYLVTYTATDAAGNETSVTRTVRVEAVDGSIVYENAEDGTTDRWRIYDNDPAGASITNVVDTDTGSNVIQLQGTGTQNGFILGNFENREGAWNDTQNTQIKWSLKSEAHFTVYVRLMTTKGWRYLYYQPVADDRGMHANGKYIHHALGTSAKDGTWQTFTRDLVADLKHYEPDNDLLAVNAFLARGNVSVDDIELSTTLTISDTTAPSLILNGESLITLQQGELYVEEGASASDYTDGVVGVSISGNVNTATSGFNLITYTATDAAGNVSSVTRTVRVVAADGSIVYENAEDGTTDRWRIFDNDPAGASITNVVDNDTASNVIQLQGTGTQNGFILGDFENRDGAWNDTQNTQIKWSLKSEAHFTVYVRLMTTKGWRYLYYQPVADDRGMHANGKYIHHALGIAAKDGTWQTFTRDLVADLKHYEPDNELLAVNAFLVRGNVSVDDVELNPILHF